MRGALMFGKPLGDYVRVQGGLLATILAVAGARLAMTLAGLPDATARWASVSAVLFLAAAGTGWWVGRSGFGGYRELYGLLLVQSAAGHLVTALGIGIGVATGVANVYTAHEYASPFGAGSWGHVAGHVLLIPIGTLPPFLLGAAFLLAARRLPRRAAPAAGPRDA